MEVPPGCCMLSLSVGDPKSVKQALVSFSRTTDGTLVTSASGLVLAERGTGLGAPVVLTTAATLRPLLTAAAREEPLRRAAAASLLPTAAVHAHLPCGRRVPLALAGVAELPGVAGALARLLSAPSTVQAATATGGGGGGWQVGWALQRQLGLGRQQAAAAAVHLAVLTLAPGAEQGAGEALRRAAAPLTAGEAAAAAAAGPLAQGAAVAAAGAPFGALSPPHFSSFVSAGAVGATLSEDCGSGGCRGSPGGAPAALALLDLRCLPGMEGGPLFTTVAGAGTSAGGWALAGMLLPPVRAPALGVELALAAPLHAVLRAARRAGGGADADTCGGAGGPGSCGPGSDRAAAGAAPEPLRRALEAVLAVSAGGSWATGVLVSGGGHVLTNAHLLDPDAFQGSGGGGAGGAGAGAGGGAGARPPVRALLRGRWLPAEALHVFSPPLDLAVLRLRQPEAGAALDLPPPLRLAEGPGAWRPGRRVCVAGFPVFSPGAGLGALLSCGTLARVVHADGAAPDSSSSSDGGSSGSSLGGGSGSGPPAMLVTTAAVHSGASGGAVLDPASGELLALVTSNARHGASGATLPHLNFAIPAPLLAPVVRAVPPPGGRGGPAVAASAAAWRALDTAAAGDEGLRSVWRLGLAQPPPEAVGRRQRQGGGGGALHSARAPAGLLDLLDRLGGEAGSGAGGVPQARL